MKLTREYVNALTGERVEVSVAELRALVEQEHTSAMMLAIARMSLDHVEREVSRIRADILRVVSAGSPR